MIRKNLYLSLILSFTLFSHNQLSANDVADMSGISEAAGESAAAAARNYLMIQERLPKHIKCNRRL